MTTYAPDPPPAPRAPTVQEPQPSSPAHRWWVLAVLSTAQLMVVLDASIVNIALPQAQADLGFSVDDRQWVVTAYSLAFGSLLLLGGRLADLLGRRRMFLTGLVGFALTSAVAGAAADFPVLVAARTGQGLFAALLTPAALSLLTTTFTEAAERARAFAVYGALAGAGGGIGLLLGGVLTQYLSWRWCLYVNLAFAAVAVAGGALWLARDRVTAGSRLDLPGTVTGTFGLFALVYVAAQAETHGWSDAVTLVGLCGGALLLVVFVALERRVAVPLLPLRVLADRDRSGGLVALLAVGAGLFAVFLFLTYYLQSSLGYGPLRTGAAFLPMVLALMAVSQVAAVVLRRLGARLPVVVGMLVAAAGLLLLAQVGIGSSYATDVLPGLVTVGTGLGCVLGPALQAAVSGVSRADASVASALTTTMQQIGGSLGTATLSTLAATAATDYAAAHGGGPTAGALAAVQGYTTAFQWGAAVFLLGAVAAGLLLRGGRLPATDAVAVAH